MTIAPAPRVVKASPQAEELVLPPARSSTHRRRARDEARAKTEHRMHAMVAPRMRSLARVTTRR